MNDPILRSCVREAKLSLSFIILCTMRYGKFMGRIEMSERYFSLRVLAVLMEFETKYHEGFVG